ncbi:hypothetical protein [Dyella japonica]|uniref:Uncharacterized protein n=1 Tax=Dyella japonica TaxID=231455 RepID=A0ABV2JY56_9GAMM
MPSPWIDLLSLHGYITDTELLRRLATRPATESPPKPPAQPGLLTLARQVARSTRLCLGIGDGVLRAQ